jgi:hypothetical protein
MLELTNFVQFKNITNLDFNISISMYKTLFQLTFHAFHFFEHL